MVAERMVDLWVPSAGAGELRKRIRELDPASYEQVAGDDSTVFRLVIAADKVEALFDELEDLRDGDHGVRAVVIPVAALAPRIEDEGDDEDSADAEGEDDEADLKRRADRVSREELYETLSDGAELRPTFFYMTILATIVASVGVSRDSGAVVIGAMVIAPLLGPNMALALATILADGKLAARALVVNGLGLLAAATTALGTGLVFGLDITAHEVAGRTTVTLGEIVLALATGAAGAIAATRGAAHSLVGVMVAVSLLPPLVIACMLLVQGHAAFAGRALLLVVSNVVCINLAAVAVFRLRGIRPRTWYDDQRSRRATLIAVSVWILLLASIVGLVLWTGVPTTQPPSKSDSAARPAAVGPALVECVA